MQSTPLEALRHPTTLGCGHNFELDLLRNHLRQGTSACPECGVAIGMAPENLKVNVAVQQLISNACYFQRFAPASAGAAVPHQRSALPPAPDATHREVLRASTVEPPAPTVSMGSIQGDRDTAAAACLLAGVSSGVSPGRGIPSVNTMTLGTKPLGCCRSSSPTSRSKRTSPM